VGRATARAFAKSGADVALIARGRDGLEAAAKEVEAEGRRTLIFPIDVASADEIERAAEEVERQLGPIDVWVNNAMVSVFSPAKDMTSEEFKRVTEVTYLGYVYGTLAALRHMLVRDRGVVVQVGSALAYRGIPLQSAYCAAKHAIEGFTESVRSELMHDKSNVHLTMVQMPALNTPQFGWVKSRLPRKPQPVPPIFQPEVAAKAILFAAEHRRREVHVGAMATATVWINKFVPGLGDRYLALTGYQSQQYNGAADPNRPHNLWEPVPGDQGAHGDFGHRANERSGHLWANTHRGILGGVLAALAGWATRTQLVREPSE
jgi:short-subunit dehydrogenase